MPILSISDIVLGEIGQMRFLFGGTPADVVEYPDGGRVASGQAVSVEGLHAVTDSWASYDPSVVPTADGNGIIPEFYGPQGILALRVDFGFGPVILRADAANLHKELRDILIARLAQLQVDEENFRGVVSAEIDAIRTTVDTVVANTLAQVEQIVSEQQDAVIQQKVEDLLDTTLAPTVDVRIDDAMANRVPPLIDAAVPPVVEAEVAETTAGMTDQINQANDRITLVEINLSNTRYDLDGVKTRTGQLETRMTSAETQMAVQSWTKTATLTGMKATLRVRKFFGVAFAEFEVIANSSNGGPTGWGTRGSLGLPSWLMPASDVNVVPVTLVANGRLVEDSPSRVGIQQDGKLFTQVYVPWDRMYGHAFWFTV